MLSILFQATFGRVFLKALRIEKSKTKTYIEKRKNLIKITQYSQNERSTKKGLIDFITHTYIIFLNIYKNIFFYPEVFPFNIINFEIHNLSYFEAIVFY